MAGALQGPLRRRWIMELLTKSKNHRHPNGHLRGTKRPLTTNKNGESDLHASWSRLEERFKTLVGDDGLFPLMMSE